MVSEQSTDVQARQMSDPSAPARRAADMSKNANYDRSSDLPVVLRRCETGRLHFITLMKTFTRLIASVQTFGNSEGHTEGLSLVKGGTLAA